MGLRSAFQTLASAALAAVLLAGCSGSSDPLPPPAPLGDVFIDNFAAGVSFQAFRDVPTAATLEVDTTVKFAGAASLKAFVPDGGWNGGAFPSEAPRNLTTYNALSFRVRASRAVTLDVVGFGNDNTGTSLYDAARRDVPVTTEWTAVVIPIPLPAKLTSERGLFYFAEGFAEGEPTDAFSLWFDDVRFVLMPTERLGAPKPSIANAIAALEIGATKSVEETKVTFPVDGVDVVVEGMPGWFTFASSSPNVATVNAGGTILAKALGTTSITAKLGTIDATGTVSVTVGQANVPTAGAPVPTEAAADVISLYSDAYPNEPITTLGTDWSNSNAGPRLTTVTLGDDDVLKFTDLLFAGIEFVDADLIDASAMTHFHVDVWTHDAALFKVKLVDFGANGVYQGTTNDDTEMEWTYNATSTPALTPDGWVSLDIPLASLPARAHLAQLILSSDEGNVYVDNLYFFHGEVVEPPPPTPAASAPAPTEAAAEVVSVYSDAFTNVPVTTLGTDWSNNSAGPRLTTLTLGDDDILKFTDLLFAGIEFVGADLIDASAKSHFHVDVWTHDATLFKVKLVDFGANGVFNGPGTADDTEHEWAFNAASTPALTRDGWVSLDIPLAAFAARAHLGQLIVSSDDGDVFVDNLYFFGTAVVEPPTGAEFPVVFDDDYADGVAFAAFGGSTNALAVDTAEHFAGTASLRVDVPAANWTGGSLVASAPKSFAPYNAVTFQVKASKASHLNVVGFGNNAAGGLDFQVERQGGLDVGTTWTRVVIPIPDGNRATAEVGLFHFGEGSEDGAYSIWFDDIKFETLAPAVIGTPVAAIATEARTLPAAGTLTVNGMSAHYPADGANCLLTPLGRGWFSWETSNASVATVDNKGVVTGVAAGTADITANLGALDANGVTTVNVTAVTGPTTAPAAPAHAAADVISLFSDVYLAHPVDAWTSVWDNTGDPADLSIAGNTVKKYSALALAGIEFTGANLVDATGMTYFHVDVWTPDAAELKVKLVDFGANAIWQGTPNDDTEHELTFVPAKGQWVSIDIPLADFANMTARAHLAQLIFVSSVSTVFFDNLYFHK
jgi:hypothetical protein